MEDGRPSVYTMLKEATHLADVIEASESGYIALDRKSIRSLIMTLMHMIRDICKAQKEIVSDAGTSETVSTN